MPILRIRLVDTAGAALAGQIIKISNSEDFRSNADGLAQFLLGDRELLTIYINGKSVWTGQSDQLTKEEKFRQGASGFDRVS